MWANTLLRQQNRTISPQFSITQISEKALTSCLCSMTTKMYKKQNNSLPFVTRTTFPHNFAVSFNKFLHVTKIFNRCI